MLKKQFYLSVILSVVNIGVFASETIIDLSSVVFPYVIDQPGRYVIENAYTFEEDIALAIHVTSDDVTLVGSLRIIDGNQNLDTFVKIENANNITLQKMKVISTNAETYIVNKSSNVLFSEVDGITTAATPVMSIIDSASVSLGIVRLSGNGNTNLSCLRASDLHMNNVILSGATGYIAEYACIFDDCIKILCQSCESQFNQNGFLIKDSKNVLMSGCLANTNTDNGFVCDNSGGTLEKVTFAACRATFNGGDGYLINGTNIELIYAQARYNQANGIFVQQATNVILNKCFTFKNEMCGILVSDHAQNVSIIELENLHDNLGGIDNSSNSLSVCSLRLVHEVVKDSQAKINNVLGSKLDTLADLSEFDQENLQVSLTDYVSTNGLSGKQLSTIAWEKALYDRLLRLEFKVNQILNTVATA